MLRKIRTLSIAFIALLMVGVMPAQAATIKIDPVYQEIDFSSTAMITADLTGAAGGFLNFYQFDITFDASILSIVSVMYLNPALGLFAFDIGPIPVSAGVLRVGQSFGISPLLLGSSVSLVKVIFDGYGAGGISPIGLVFSPLASSTLIINGSPVTPYLEPGSIKVPEPGIVLLLGIGLAGVISSRRKMALQA